MGFRNNNVQVDFDKLENVLKRRDMTLKSASADMGRTPSYLSTMKPKGYLPEATLVTMEALWGVRREEIAPSVSDAEPRAEVYDMDELKAVITEAIKDAFVWYANQR